MFLSSKLFSQLSKALSLDGDGGPFMVLVYTSSKAMSDIYVEVAWYHWSMLMSSSSSLTNQLRCLLSMLNMVVWS